MGDTDETARSFFERLREESLDLSIPEGWLQEVALSGNSDATGRFKLACDENLLLYHFWLPKLFATVRTFFGLSQESARDALKGEYWRKFPEFLSGNPFRSAGYPFPKVSTSDKSIFERWKAGNAAAPFQAYPDFGIRSPSAPTVAIEGKLHRSGSGEESIVSALREASFYRGLPDPETGRNMWDYGLAIVLDRSDDQSAVKAWNALPEHYPFLANAKIHAIIIGRGAG